MMSPIFKQYQTLLQTDLFEYAPLVHCITNEITIESVANALLYTNAKPIMADDPREFEEIFQQTDALFLNLGNLSADRDQCLSIANRLAQQTQKPVVLDLVGLAASKLRRTLAQDLIETYGVVVKGNLSEMRTLCGLTSNGRGVDGGASDQTEAALTELTKGLQDLARKRPEICFLGTGPTDVVVTHDTSLWLKNGVPEMDQFTGTGDIVGGLITSFLGRGLTPLTAVIVAVSYFNICGETAVAQGRQPLGLADFRQQILNNLSLLKQEQWYEKIKGAFK
ncbi:hydroxyethylthiazole kinase [Agrilactobacillus yilanensis]|uniref:Hydroxyethylthiazole kinase n=1 Tax=Agrilactobacillus yilanensis TaxID=2485997 RepID=A0ABW4J7V3_9LACO|nr:hydroxyethylthiazole kinase [Agrilactobacillus yilanensis]